MTWTTVLRPIHTWFFLWEQLVPSIYRVVATGLAGLATAVLLATAGVHPLVAIGIAVPLWVALAVAQEHDDRVMLAPDPEFLTALTEAAARSPLGLRVDHSQGPSRARGGTSDAFVLTTAAPGGRLAGAYIRVARSSREGWMEVHVSGDVPGGYTPFEARLRDAGRPELARRTREARTADGDARAVVEALEVVLL